jgi:hypothetical protein
MRTEGRRDHRFRVIMPLELRHAGRVIRAQSGDVSLRGLFLRTEVTFEKNQFIGFELDLPFLDARVRLHGRVAFCRSGGCGIQFYGNGSDELELWGKFVGTLAERFPQSLTQDVWLGAENACALVETPVVDNRRFDVIVQVMAHVSSSEDLLDVHRLALDRRAMFIPSRVLLERGERFTLCIIHPSHQAEFLVPCVVERTINDDARRGMMVELELHAGGEAQLLEFIHDEGEELDFEEAELIAAPA